PSPPGREGVGEPSPPPPGEPPSQSRPGDATRHEGKEAAPGKRTCPPSPAELCHDIENKLQFRGEKAEMCRLGQTLSPHGSGSVSADVIREHLRQHGGDW